MPGSAALSSLLGYTSIACWLGAQFPQVIKNIQRRSCEGLSLPFLANWLLGDFSNLVGCILTHQLPFQTWLATYFVCVDLALVVQYFYYLPRPPVLAPSYTARAASSAPGTLPRHSFDRGATRYRTLSAAAANVAAAAAAALAAQEDGEAARHSAHEADPPPSHPVRSGNLTSRIPLAREDHAHGDSDGDSSAVLADSFHSEAGRAVSKSRLTWSPERYRPRAESAGTLSGIAPLSLISANGEDMWRGRRLQRQSDGLPEVDLEATATSAALSSPSTVANRRDSRAGKKSATMVFLGVWALFSVGTLAGSRRGMPTTSSASVGKVLSPLEVVGGALNLDAAITESTTSPMLEPSPIPNTVSEIPLIFGDQDPLPQLSKSEAPAPSAERILGRIFAWLCTTLYLTSRLPQIWKNYVRQSVEGLSMYLFVFAFLGNTFYVASILSSPNCFLPPPASTEFFKESVPYLLGSGGTLIFDITIVSQSFLYRPTLKRRYARSRSNTAAIDENVEEERVGLLSGDDLARHHPRHQQPPHPLSSGTDGGAVAGGEALSRGWTSQVTRSLTE